MPKLTLVDSVRALRAIREAAARRRDQYDPESSRYLELNAVVGMVDEALSGRLPIDPLRKSDSDSGSGADAPKR